MPGSHKKMMSYKCSGHKDYLDDWKTVEGVWDTTFHQQTNWQ